MTTFSLDEFYGPSQLDDLKFSLQSSEIAKLKLGRRLSSYNYLVGVNFYRGSSAIQ